MKKEFEQILQELLKEDIVRSAIETARRKLGNVKRLYDLFSIKEDFERTICNVYGAYRNIEYGNPQTVARNILRTVLEEYNIRHFCKIDSLCQEHKENVEKVLAAINIPYYELPESMRIGLRKIIRDDNIRSYTKMVRDAVEKIFIDFVVREM